jgi:thymidylate synthase
MFTRGIIREILWYLRGEANIKYLKEHNVTIWDEWAKEDGSLGPVYGVQWRKWRTYKHSRTLSYTSGEAGGCDVWEDIIEKGPPIDQIASLINKLKTNPNDRRMIVSAWNVADLPEMGLPPCHYAFQCYAKPLRSDQRARMFLERTGSNPEDLTGEDLDRVFDQALVPRYELSMILNQRSCDIALGVPFNIVQYSILLRMLAQVANMTPGEFVWNGGDVHIYENHLDGLNTQLERTPLPAPTFRFARDVTDIDDFKYEDFVIEGYESHPTIRFDVAV